MFYRVRIDLAFKDPGIYTGLINHALGVLNQAQTINPGQPNEERGFIIEEQCFHDENPTTPCELIEDYYTD